MKAGEFFVGSVQSRGHSIRLTRLGRSMTGLIRIYIDDALWRDGVAGTAAAWKLANERVQELGWKITNPVQIR